jgi:GTP-binding protein EngB required for normal cell division
MTQALMDLRSYEREKFAIADILRSASLLARYCNRDCEGRIEELLARLAEDRFNLVVVGRFSRGKTSLMNAILATNLLPTGILPLTSVITTIGYGSKEQVILRYHGRILEQEVPIAELPLYITQQGNPGNIRGLKVAEVQLPAEFLRRGFYFVDTPGLGSAIEENTRTTESFLPEADALLLVTSFDGPLTEEEMGVVKAAALCGKRLFVVVNKHDTVGTDVRDTAISFVTGQLQAIVGHAASPVFSISAQDGLKAKQSRDEDRLLASGIPMLEKELVRFLLTEKSAHFLLRMCARVADLVQALPPSDEAVRLLQRLRELRNSIARAEPDIGTQKSDPAKFPTLHQRQSCEVCAHAVRALWDFLCKYQYDLSTSEDQQQRLAEHGGLCSLHTWYYASMAPPRDICKAYPNLFEHLAASLRQAAQQDTKSEILATKIRCLLATPQDCPFCVVRTKAEREAIASIKARLAKDQEQAISTCSTICLPHFAMLADVIEDANVLARLMEFEAIICERLAEDMRRYALKLDAVRRHLVSDEETAAAQRALMLVAQHRHITAAARTK